MRSEVIDLLQGMQRYSNPALLSRMQERYGWTKERFQTEFDELKRFLVLAAYSRTRIAMLREDTDALWHEFLLMHSDYRLFCGEFLGGYVGHESTSPEPDVAASTTRLHERWFGAPPGAPAPRSEGPGSWIHRAADAILARSDPRSDPPSETGSPSSSAGGDHPGKERSARGRARPGRASSREAGSSERRE